MLTTIAQSQAGILVKNKLHFALGSASKVSLPPTFLSFFQFFPLKALESSNSSSHSACGITGLLLTMHWASLQQHNSVSQHSDTWRCRDTNKRTQHVTHPCLTTPTTTRCRSWKLIFWVTSNLHFGALLAFLQCFYKPVYNTIDNGRSCWGSQWTHVDNKPL